MPGDRHRERDHTEEHGREPGRVSGEAEARAGGDVVDAQRQRQPAGGPTHVRIGVLGSHQRPDDDEQAVGREPGRRDQVGGRVDLGAQVVADEDADERRDGIPHGEDERRLDRPAQGRLQAPEHDRDPEVVEAQGEPECEKRDHLVLPDPTCPRARTVRTYHWRRPQYKPLVSGRDRPRQSSSSSPSAATSRPARRTASWSGERSSRIGVVLLMWTSTTRGRARAPRTSSDPPAPDSGTWPIWRAVRSEMPRSASSSSRQNVPSTSTTSLSAMRRRTSSSRRARPGTYVSTPPVTVSRNTSPAASTSAPVPARQRGASPPAANDSTSSEVPSSRSDSPGSSVHHCAPL